MDFTMLDKKLLYYHENKELIPEAVRQNYEEVFNIEYTHNSTAIEGNTLSLAETKLILEDGISPNGKNMREVFEVFNHGKAYAYALKCISENKVLSKEIVKDIHEILMENIMYGGIYRNVNVYISGAKHTPPSPDEAYRQLDYFYSDMIVYQKEKHPINYAAWTHAEFVKIHPFVDGNGRTSRLLMNYQLAAAGYLPISIPKERRLEYFDTLEAYACENNLLPFINLISTLEEARLDLYITAIEQVKTQITS
jgi:Fic family protein